MEFCEAWDDTCSAVGLAARAGDMRKLQKLIRSSCVDVADNRGWRPLHEAAVHAENLECLEELLKHNSTNVDWVTHEGETALLLVCKRRGENTISDAVRLLLEYGASPNLSDNEEETALLVATKNKNLDVVQQLLANGADPDIGDCSGWKPLHQAAMSGHKEILRRLLEAKASIDVQDECGMTPLFTAAQHGKAECLWELLREAKERGQENIVNMGAEDWATPLMIAAQQGYKACVQILLSHGANPDLKTTDNITALHLAVQGDFHECLQLLIENMDLKPFIDMCHPANVEHYQNLQDDFTSPIHLALEWGSHACLKMLLDCGFSPDSIHPKTNLPTDFFLPEFMCRYDSAVSFAVCKEDKTALTILFDAGANRNVPSTYPYTLHPIVRALALPCPDMLNFLLDHGSDVNFCRPTIQTNEIFLASFVLQYHMELLLLCGCDPQLCFQNEKSINFFASAIVMNTDQLNLIRKLQFVLQFVTVNGSVQNACHAVSKKARIQHHHSEPENLQEILSQISQPSLLKHICRMKIRHHMYSLHGPRFLRHLNTLSLPPLVIAYLSFSISV